jgi:type VI secretion system protein ImpE
MMSKAKIQKEKKMNEAKALLDAGKLNEAIQATLTHVRTKPTDITARTFLFELSCFSGDWERAEKQLDVIGNQDVNAQIGSLIYKQNFKAERDRLRVFNDGMIPECLMLPPKYIEDLVVTSTHIREGRITEARELLDQIEQDRPAFACKINGEDSVDFRDYNDLTMCVFEAIVKDSYTWLPFEHIEKIKFLPAKSLRDMYWIQAEVEMTNGTNGEMFLPALYVETHKNDNDQIRLGRATDWREVGEDIFIGEGVRTFQYEGGYIPISKIETLEFIHETEEKEEAEAA